MPPKPNLVKYKFSLYNGRSSTIYCLRYYRKTFKCRDELIRYWSTKVNPNDLDEMEDFNNLVTETIRID